MLIVEQLNAAPIIALGGNGAHARSEMFPMKVTTLHATKVVNMVKNRKSK